MNLKTLNLKVGDTIFMYCYPALAPVQYMVTGVKKECLTTSNTSHTVIHENYNGKLVTFDKEHIWYKFGRVGSIAVISNNQYILEEHLISNYAIGVTADDCIDQAIVRIENAK